jgi:hypothetical protein
MILIVLQFWLANQSGTRDSGFELVPAAALVLAVAADLAYRMNTVVRVTAEDLAIEPPLVMRKVVQRQRVGGVALRGVFSYVGSTMYAVIYDDHGRSIATLPQGIWDEEDLRRLQAALGTKDRAIRYVSAAELGTEFPGALTVVRYAGWALAAAVVVLIFVGASIEHR